MNSTLTAIVLAVAALGAWWLFSSGVKAGRSIQRAVYRVAVLGRVVLVALVAGGLIAGWQWYVLTRTQPSPAMVVATLAAPALLAGVTVGRMVATVLVVRYVARLRGGRGGRR